MLILESPWTRQPQVEVGADRGNPLTRGLVVLATPNAGYFLSTYKPASRVSADVYTQAFGRMGGAKSYAVSGINGYVALGSGAEVGPLLNTGQITVLTVATPAVATRGDMVTRWNIGSSGATTEQFNLLTGVTANKPELFISDGTNLGSSGASAITVVVGQPAVIVGSHSTSNCRVYVDGVLGASGTAGNRVMSSTSTQSLYIGNNVTAANPYAGYQALTAIWNRQLTDEEVWVVSQNPWQLFDPQQIIIPTPAAAAGYTHPTLSAATAIDVTATSFKPRVTYTFA